MGKCNNMVVFKTDIFAYSLIINEKSNYWSKAIWFLLKNIKDANQLMAVKSLQQFCLLIALWKVMLHKKVHRNAVDLLLILLRLIYKMPMGSWYLQKPQWISILLLTMAFFIVNNGTSNDLLTESVVKLMQSIIGSINFKV